MKIDKNFFVDNFKTIFYALIIALLIRSIIIQPFYIPSSSMEPNLLVGDRLFVTKYSFGYSKHSFPFSLPLFKGKILSKIPKRGDVIVFKTPADNRTDYIKRLIGLPGDKIKFIDGDLHINDNLVLKTRISTTDTIYCGDAAIPVNTFEEKLPNGKKYVAVYRKKGSMIDSDKFIVPMNHYFFMGDNRDCSKDSRFLSSVGFVNFNNLVGKAQFIFFSNDKQEGLFIQFWKWGESIRLQRFFKKIL